jgi:hypothetical protein
MNCDWENYILKCEEILEEKEIPFVTEIHTWIDEHRHITDSQSNRIDDIFDELF